MNKIQIANIINNFFESNNKSRYLELINSKKGLKKFFKALSHKINFEKKFVRSIPSNQQNIDAIMEQLKLLKAEDTCYVISEDQSINDTMRDTYEAISYVLGSGQTTMLSFLDGSLVYFEGEQERFILSK